MIVACVALGICSNKNENCDNWKRQPVERSAMEEKYREIVPVSNSCVIDAWLLAGSDTRKTIGWAANIRRERGPTTAQ